MDSLSAPSAPFHSAPQNRDACPSLPPQSRCASPPPARSSQQTLHRRTQSHHVHRPSDAKGSSRKLYFHSSRRQRQVLTLHRFCGSLRLHLHRQKMCSHADAQPPFAIQLAPVEHLVGIHIVSSGHSRHRGPRHQRLLHNVPSLFNGSAPLLRLRHLHLRHLTQCVHVSSLW